VLGIVSMPVTVPPAHAKAPPIDPSTTQLVVVVTPGWDAPHGTLSAFDRDAAGAWRQRGTSHPVMIGRNGCAWGRGLHSPAPAGPEKREGDGRSPAGLFPIGPAFGAAAACDTGLDYRPMTGDDWCIDVPASPLYNRTVNRRDVGAAAVVGSTEPMRRDLAPTADGQYAIGFMIGHNPRGTAGMGSCIFGHVVAGPGVPTSGCTGFAERDLRTLLAWLRADARPLFVLLPRAEVHRLSGWGLPEALARGTAR